jgi:hypothetical protein
VDHSAKNVERKEIKFLSDIDKSVERLNAAHDAENLLKDSLPAYSVESSGLITKRSINKESKMKVIGLGHKARQGKNTLAKMIISEAVKRGMYGREIAYADALRAFARVLGMRQKNARLLQSLGTNVMREINQDIWIEILNEVIWEFKGENLPLVVVTDVRFPNEAQFLKDNHQATIIKVTRLNKDGTIFQAPDRDPFHPSETALDSWDFDYETQCLSLSQLEEEAGFICDKFLLSKPENRPSNT